MEYEEILKELRAIRMKKKISCERLGKHIDKTKMMVSYLENGKSDIRLKDFLKICEVLEISPCALLIGDKTDYYNTAVQLHNLSDRDFLIVKKINIFYGNHLIIFIKYKRRKNHLSAFFVFY